MDRTKSEAGLKINGIRKVHQLSLVKEGIREKKLSCMICGVDSLCFSCKTQKLKFTAEKIKDVLESDKKEIGEHEDSDEEPVIENVGNSEEEEHDTCEFNGEDEQDTGAREDEQDLSVGDVVWVLYNRRWTAGKIVTLSDIPDTSLSRQLKSNSGSTSLVKFYHDQSFHRAANTKIELLAQNLVDQSRGRHHPMAYLEALSDLSYG